MGMAAIAIDPACRERSRSHHVRTHMGRLRPRACRAAQSAQPAQMNTPAVSSSSVTRARSKVRPQQPHWAVEGCPTLEVASVTAQCPPLEPATAIRDRTERLGRHRRLSRTSRRPASEPRAAVRHGPGSMPRWRGERVPGCVARSGQFRPGREALVAGGNGQHACVRPTRSDDLHADGETIGRQARRHRTHRQASEVGRQREHAPVVEERVGPLTSVPNAGTGMVGVSSTS